MMTRLIDLRTAERSYPTVEISWALDALCAETDASAEGLRDRLATRLISSFNPRSGLFPHILGPEAGGPRFHVSCFADAVYPIHALSNYSRASGSQEALHIAARCADRICQLQGPAGQWWWHYDYRTGQVIEDYPVYSVHQHAMAPMALFALRDAGGPDHTDEIHRGMAWLGNAPEIGASLVDTANEVIWRKVARREPNKLSRYAQAMVSRLHPALRVPGLDALFPPTAVDWECRPYEPGWLLYAWPAARARRWDSLDLTAKTQATQS
jgi:hypothetical protein